MNYQNPSNFDPFQPQAPVPAPKKKSSHPVLAAFSVLGVLIILALATFIYYLLFLAPTRSVIFGNQGSQVNVQETALQAAAEATAIEIYLHPSQIPPSQAEPTQVPPVLIQPQTNPEVSGMQVEGQALEEPSEKSEHGQTDAGMTKRSFSAQVGLLGLLGLATLLLLVIIIVRRLRSSKK